MRGKKREEQGRVLLELRACSLEKSDLSAVPRTCKTSLAFTVKLFHYSNGGQEGCKYSRNLGMLTVWSKCECVLPPGLSTCMKSISSSPSRME